MWTPEEIRSALGGSASGLLIVSKSKQDVSDAALFIDAYGVTERGNFEGKNILNLARDVDVLAAFAEAARVLKREEYRQVAVRNAEFLLEHLTADGGRQTEASSSWSVVGRRSSMRLLRSYKDGQARLNGYLEDYANLAEGLMALYETMFEKKYWVAARGLANMPARILPVRCR